MSQYFNQKPISEAKWWASVMDQLGNVGKNPNLYEDMDAPAPPPEDEMKIGHGLDRKLKIFLDGLEKTDLTRANLKNLAKSLINSLHKAMVDDEGLKDAYARNMLMKDIRSAFQEVPEEEAPEEEAPEEEGKNPQDGEFMLAHQDPQGQEFQGQ
ncbi:MAG: hypothetical protein WCJ72_04205 [Chryseobacterium sp.]